MKYVIPILSLIISVIALAVALPRPNNLGIDYLGVIVAIISLATAFAVGFQIWNALSLEKRLNKIKTEIELENEEKISSLKKNMVKDLKKESEKLQVVVLHESAIATAIIALSNSHYSESFYFFIQALDYQVILKDKFDVEFSSHDTVDDIIESFIDKHSFNITSIERQKYIIRTIIKSGNEELIEKIGLIKTKIFSSEN